jgi:hypothetical protein
MNFCVSWLTNDPKFRPITTCQCGLQQSSKCFLIFSAIREPEGWITFHEMMRMTIERYGSDDWDEPVYLLVQLSIPPLLSPHDQENDRPHFGLTIILEVVVLVERAAREGDGVLQDVVGHVVRHLDLGPPHPRPFRHLLAHGVDNNKPCLRTQGDGRKSFSEG